MDFQGNKYDSLITAKKTITKKMLKRRMKDPKFIIVN